MKKLKNLLKKIDDLCVEDRLDIFADSVFVTYYSLAVIGLLIGIVDVVQKAVG